MLRAVKGVNLEDNSIFRFARLAPCALPSDREKHRRLDLFVFLGDGTDDAVLALEAYPSLPRIIVSGNREEYLSSFLTFPPFPFEAEFEEQSVKFLALHGHRSVNVKGSLVAAAS